MRIARYEDGDTLIKTFESITLQKKKLLRENSLYLSKFIFLSYFSVNQSIDYKKKSLNSKV